MSDILRWVADQYRQALFAISKESCYEVDKSMIRSGQGWICNQSIADPNELLTAKDIEKRFGFHREAVRSLALRYKIDIRGKRGNANLYRLGDVLSARAAKKVSRKHP